METQFYSKEIGPAGVVGVVVVVVVVVVIERTFLL